MTNPEYLDFSEEDIDNLLFGCNTDTVINSIVQECISCKSDKIVIDDSLGYHVCQDCGVVNEIFLDKNPIYNKESDDKANTSYGCPTNYFYPKSALGTKIKAKGYNRLSILQGQCSMPYKEKSLRDELIKINDKCRLYNITPTIIDTAKILYKKVNDSKHTKGIRKGKSRIMRCINRKSMIAACVFYACKLQNEPRSPKEIADIYSLEIKHVNRGYRKFIDFINVEELFTQFTSSKSTDFIKRFAGKLEMSEQYIKIAIDISNNINKLDLASTHEPPSVAAGCLLLVVNTYNLSINKKQISDVFGISDVTISKTYRRIWPYHKIICNNEITQMIMDKKQNMPKYKCNISLDNLIILKAAKDTDSITDSNIDNIDSITDTIDSYTDTIDSYTDSNIDTISDLENEIKIKPLKSKKTVKSVKSVKSIKNISVTI
jgi:transcription initiation factor TFIIB